MSSSFVPQSYEIVSHEDATLPRSAEHPSPCGPQEHCLVQIYPVDVVEGMLLLEANTLCIGRDQQCDLVIADSSVSRQHAQLLKNDTQNYLIRDLNSTNGTIVNGQRMSERVLESGDTVQLGSFIFRFLSAGSVESQYHETVYTAMTRDVLTGALNKRYLQEMMHRELVRCQRQGDRCVVIMMDMDHFKKINDAHGHLVGDEVLREFSGRILNLCREDDLFARYGGEEFCLMLSNSSEVEGRAMAERCRIAVASEPFQTHSGPLAITSSFGVAEFRPEAHESVAGLLGRADAWLYEAKRCGRNCVVGSTL